MRGKYFYISLLCLALCFCSLLLAQSKTGPKTKGKPAVDAEGHQWWQHAVFYEIYPRSYMDSNNDGIGDLPGNRTRFVVLTRPDAGPLALRPTGTRRRTTLVVAVRNEPGTLVAVLRVIAGHELNMHKLESRPSRERAWEYVFWIDLDGDVADPSMAAALAELGGVTTMCRVLGSYPAAPEG